MLQGAGVMDGVVARWCGVVRWVVLQRGDVAGGVAAG